MRASRAADPHSPVRERLLTFDRPHPLRAVSSAWADVRGGRPLGSHSSDAGHTFLVLDRLHHVQLAMPAGCAEAAREFFVDVLGMTELAKPTSLATRGGAWFRSGGVELHLGVEEPFQPARKAHPGVLVDDLDELAARLTSSGIPIVWDDDLPAFRRIYVNDPFGNRLEFLQASR